MLELWFQQDFFERGDDGPAGLLIRVGQLTADSEFVISDCGALFTNGTLGGPLSSTQTFPRAVRAIPWAPLAYALQ
jgi:hypothetical protein